MSERWTVLKLLQWTAEYFADKGIDSARLDAELLLAATLDIDRVGLYVNFERPLDKNELTEYREKIKRRAGREPVQYILGQTEFWSLPFKVNPEVLIPRPDTEVLVEEAVKKIGSCALILDVGTGSGAVAVALAHEFNDLQVNAIDCSNTALRIAQENAEINQVAERVNFFERDLRNLPEGPYDLVVSNPPYIPSRDWEELMPEVRDYEPRLALDGGTDGLDVYRQLMVQAGRELKPGGWLLVEVGINQAKDVSNLFVAAGFNEVVARNDYAGIQRVVMGQK